MTDIPRPPSTLIGVRRGGLDKTFVAMDLSALIPATDDSDQPGLTLIDTGQVAAGPCSPVAPVAREVAETYDMVVLDSPPSMLGPLPSED